MRLVDQWALSIQQWGDLGVVPVGPLDKLTQAPFLMFFPTWGEDTNMGITQTSKITIVIYPWYIFFPSLLLCD